MRERYPCDTMKEGVFGCLECVGTALTTVHVSAHYNPRKCFISPLYSG